MLVAFNLKVVPYSGRGIQGSRETFPVNEIPMTSSTKSTMSGVKCSLNTSSENLRGKVDNSLVTIHPLDISSNLCMVDTLQSLGVDRYFQSEINTVLEDTYRLWKVKDIIFKDVSCCAMAFRLLRVKGYQVSSDELAPFAEQEVVRLQTSDFATILELYRASQERLYEDEDILEKLHDWSSNLLKQHLLNQNIPDHKLHKQVGYFLKNYHGILDRVAVRRSLDLYNINYYQIPEVADRFPNEDLLEFSRQDFNICQAQHQKELQQLHRWYADCRLDALNHGTDVVGFANFLTAAIFGEPEFSEARLAFAKTITLVTRMDDFFDHDGSTEESYKILDLVQEWEEKPAEEYGSKEVEILFTAVYNTVNNLAEKAYIEQGRCVKPLLIKLWVEILTSFKKELDSWTEETALTLDEYLSFSWVSIGCRICILSSLQFVGIKLTDEMVWSQECVDLCRHVSSVVRLLNDVQTFEKERLENTINSVDVQLAAHQGITEEEAIAKIKEMVEYHRRKLMQIVYKEGTVFGRECKDVFLRVCRIGYYLYSGDELTSPQQMKEDMKSLVYQPVTLNIVKQDAYK
uniref:Labd-13(16),14-diene-9-ol synthase n=1 Tax=Leonurus japonicus TaxID=4138 RepID=A0A976XVE4_LEOJA|nr:labd-13(16),14-diene-9-ol synthase [Leonurus japonicus]